MVFVLEWITAITAQRVAVGKFGNTHYNMLSQIDSEAIMFTVDAFMDTYIYRTQ